jgi:hypothetical protein
MMPAIMEMTMGVSQFAVWGGLPLMSSKASEGETMTFVKRAAKDISGALVCPFAGGISVSVINRKGSSAPLAFAIHGRYPVKLKKSRR